MKGTSARASAAVQRVAFVTSRLGEFCSQRELVAQTGHAIENWPLVVLKECADNALDICEEKQLAPVIEIEVDTDTGKIVISDNGPGIAPEIVTSILDYSTRISSREAYITLSRGAQGNALKCLLAMPFALDNAHCGPVVIEAQGIAHRIQFGANQVTQEPQIAHETATSLVKSGTRLTLYWPDSASWILEQAEDRFLQICDDLLWLNPHLSMLGSWNDVVEIDWTATEPQWRKWRVCDPSSPHWFTRARLERLAGAYIADDRNHHGRPDRSLRSFIAEFAGLTSTAKQKRLLDELGAARTSLSNFCFDEADQANRDANLRLLSAMQAYSQPIKPDRLGVIGKDHISACFADAGVEPESFKYGRAFGMIDDLPYVVEAAFGWRPEATSRRIITGINWSVALGNPFRAIGGYGESLDSLLTAQRAGWHEPIMFVLHVACPVVSYTDRGKTAAILPDGSNQKIVDLVRQVTAAWCKQRKAEERNAAAERNRRDRLIRPTRKMSIKEAAWSVMSGAYAHASDNGRLPAKPRQVMYAARPQILELTGKESLNDEYFTQTLLPDYIEANPAECKTWDVVYDARGSLIEPHTDRKIPLGTQEVRNYLNSRAEQRPLWPIALGMEQGKQGQERTEVGGIGKSRRFSTIGPENRYSSVLVIEKEGFDDLLSRAAIRARYDIAIASTKGLSTVAARLAVDQLSARGVQVFGLHDFDVTGFTIFGTLAKNSRRYRFDNAVPIIDIGLRLVDVQEMDLQSEPVSVSGEWSKRAETLATHGATAGEIEFLKDRRVELNAMTSRQLVDLIERKLAEHGVEKVIPDAAVMEQHARYWLELELADRALKKAVPHIQKQLAAIKLPTDLRQLVEAELQRDPYQAWDIAVTNVLPALPGASTPARRRRG